MKTTDKKSVSEMSQWWLCVDDGEAASQMLSTAAFLKESQGFRNRQAAIYARLYGNMALMNFIGSNMSKMDQSTGLPTDRPTFNIIQSAIDTKVAKISQSRPAPVFLTDNGDYRERNLAKKLNNFILGEFYNTKAYDKATMMLRDGFVEGTGCLKVFETPDHRVGVERVLLTELLIDPSESIYEDPRQLYQLKLVDRAVLIASFPKFKDILTKAEKAYPDNSADSSKTVSDLVMVVEGWHLRSGKEAKDGRHTIACSAGIIFDEEFKKDKFPFVFYHDSKRLLGFWSQGTAERLMGTQMEINSLLYTISKAIKLVGVPRIFQEVGSKVTKASHNNDIGTIVEYKGVKPSYEVAECVPQELYAQLQRMIEYGFQQEGVSTLDAAAQKPAGLNSGEAIRSYSDISNDRLALASRNYDNVFVDLAYLIVDTAKDICEEQGSYSTVYPNKNGVKEIDLPKASILNDSYVIQCFNMSSLPRDPAGRMQKIVEMMQSGMITVKEGRRLLDYPDTQQMDMLANAAEERILQILDDIVERGKYTPPDPFLDLDLANELTVCYYNLYSSAKLEEDKQQQLRDFYSQIQAMKQAAMPPAAPPGAIPGVEGQPGATMPAAAPQALPTSDLIPNGNVGGAQ